jgi:hypothetical protein
VFEETLLGGAMVRRKNSPDRPLLTIARAGSYG